MTSSAAMITAFEEAHSLHWVFRAEAEQNKWPFTTPDFLGAAYYALSELGEVGDAHQRSLRPYDARREDKHSDLNGELADLWLMLDTMNGDGDVSVEFIKQAIIEQSVDGPSIVEVVFWSTSAVRSAIMTGTARQVVYDAQVAIMRMPGFDLVAEVQKTIDDWRGRCVKPVEVKRQTVNWLPVEEWAYSKENEEWAYGKKNGVKLVLLTAFQSLPSVFYFENDRLISSVQDNYDYPVEVVSLWADKVDWLEYTHFFIVEGMAKE